MAHVTVSVWPSKAYKGEQKAQADHCDCAVEGKADPGSTRKWQHMCWDEHWAQRLGKSSFCSCRLSSPCPMGGAGSNLEGSGGCSLYFYVTSFLDLGQYLGRENGTTTQLSFSLPFLCGDVLIMAPEYRISALNLFSHAINSC